MSRRVLDVVVAIPARPCLHRLHRALFSLAMQDHAPVVVHLVCAGPTEPVLDHLGPTLSLHPSINLRPRSLEPAASRAALLEAGGAAAQGELLAFLDQDAVIHPDGYTELAAALDHQGTAAASGLIAVKFETCTAHACVTLARWMDATPRPLHRFMLRRREFAALAWGEPDPLEHLRACRPEAIRSLRRVVGDLYLPDAPSLP